MVIGIKIEKKETTILAATSRVRSNRRQGRTVYPGFDRFQLSHVQRYCLWENPEGTYPAPICFVLPNALKTVDSSQKVLIGTMCCIMF
jgi:hypothetical protein